MLCKAARRGGNLAGLISTATLHAVPASAQSSMTFYGVVDTGIRYTTHADPQGNSAVRLANSGATESLFGFKGTEDLGAGNKAVFHFEDRFSPNTGATDPAYPFFNTASVGLQSSTCRKLTMGRQINPLSDAVLSAFVSIVRVLTMNGVLPPQSRRSVSRASRAHCG
ncbi:porin [Paraburkholderia bengalensis]|uniref:porin n=1 Tax=Paraburkholderia bengalensis TaxID=2747562 RepID=UPI003014905C